MNSKEIIRYTLLGLFAAFLVGSFVLASRSDKNRESRSRIIQKSQCIAKGRITQTSISDIARARHAEFAFIVDGKQYNVPSAYEIPCISSGVSHSTLRSKLPDSIMVVYACSNPNNARLILTEKEISEFDLQDMKVQTSILDLVCLRKGISIRW